jgi:DNA-binding NtrC family response regulator
VKRGPLLLVEDHPGLRAVLVDAATGEGIEVEAVETVAAARRCLTTGKFAFALTDLKLPDGTGLEVVDAARRSSTPVVVMTAFGSVGTAVEAMKRGAVDFLEKPVELDDLLSLLATHLPATVAEQPPFRAPGGPELVGTAPAFRGALRLLERAAKTDVTVLLLGESGTGKELFARSLHLLSARKGAPFVAVNCAAIPAALVESELFGHEKGAFTGAHQRQIGRFEAAGKGTLFLDEVGELPLEVQAKVLRAVEERVIERVGGSGPIAVDLRLVAATNRDLEEMIGAGSFRADLYYRLAIFPIRLPALRERAEDVGRLARHLLAKAAERHGSGARHLDPAALDWLQHQPWPGNVRELANVLERAAIVAEGESLSVTDLAGPAAPPGSTTADGERNRIAAALEAAAGDHQQAAHALGISYRTLMRRLDQYDLRGLLWRNEAGS